MRRREKTLTPQKRKGQSSKALSTHNQPTTKLTRKHNNNLAILKYLIGVQNIRKNTAFLNLVQLPFTCPLWA
jgi:hypothetical protein